MNITKSDILKREFQNALLLQNKSENELKDERNRYEQQIERSKNNIKDSLTRLRQYNENKEKLSKKIKKKLKLMKIFKILHRSGNRKWKKRNIKINNRLFGQI